MFFNLAVVFVTAEVSMEEKDQLPLVYYISKMADNLNQPLVFTANEAAVFELLQALYPQVNYIELVFRVEGTSKMVD